MSVLRRTIALAPVAVACCFLMDESIASETDLDDTVSSSEECVVGDDGACVTREEDDTADDAFVYHEDMSILDVLNPGIIGNATLMQEISDRLHDHDLVVIRDAFVPEFADYVWEELFRDDLEWPLWEEWNDDGFSFHHHNFYDVEVSCCLSSAL